MGKNIRNSRKKKIPKEDISESLNEKQKLFCYLYIADRECFGNASKAYRTAYNLTPAQYKAARVSAHHLLANPNIQAYINKLLDESFTENFADRALSTVMTQTKDLPSKIAAIKEFNKLKQRITEKADITSGGEPIRAIKYIVPDPVK